MSNHPGPTEPLVRWREWVCLQHNLSWIYEGPVAASNRHGYYSPDHMGAWLVRRGQVTLKQPDRTVVAKAGEWLIPWPGFRQQDFSDDAVILSVRFHAAWPDGKPFFERGLSVTFPAREHPELEDAAMLLLRAAGPSLPTDPTQLASNPVPFARFLKVQEAMIRWLGVFYAVLVGRGLHPSRVGIRDERIVAALQRLDALPFSERCREGALAAEFGLGVSQFVRLFRQELGETPKQYFDQRRRDYCRQMLVSSAVPIKEISYNLGFERLSDFSAWFKKHYKLSPRQFRQQATATPAV